MAALFARARTEQLWFYCGYQGLWFSPDELSRAQEEGRFRWGAGNWELRNPEEAIRPLEKQVAAIAKEIADLRERIARG